MTTLGAPHSMEEPVPRLTPQSTPQLTPQLTLYSRAWCHLCDEMRAALEPLASAFGATVQLVDIDIDADPALVALYDELVPVLVYNGVQLCHYRLDEARVRAALAPHGA